MLFHSLRSYLAKALASLAIAALPPALAQGSEIAFTFTGAVDSTPFTATFDVNTLAAGNTLQDTFEKGFLQTVNINVFATDFNVTLGGVPVLTDAADGGLTLQGINPVNTGTGAFFSPIWDLARATAALSSTWWIRRTSGSPRRVRWQSKAQAIRSGCC